MKTKLFALLAALVLSLTAPALAEEAAPVPAPAGESFVAQDAEPVLTEAYRWFINSYKRMRGVNVVYYDNVYAVNHGEWGLTPFASDVPEEYFVVDTQGYYAIAPLVMDIADAMRVRLYGGDTGALGLLYGQYCERILSIKREEGFSGVHEGIDFISEPGAPLYTILDGVVTRAGDSNGTVGVYSEEYDITLLYLHCEDIAVKRGDEIEAGTLIGYEGKKGSGSAYAHVEMRRGRHTSSSKYRDTKLESDCPYEVMRTALGVQDSGREAVTYAAAQHAQRAAEEQRRIIEEEAAREAAEAERLRLEAEAAAAAAAAQRQAEEEAARAAAEATPEVKLVDVLPGTQQEGYGFAEETSAPETTPAPGSEAVPAAGATPAAEATLPPANP